MDIRNFLGKPKKAGGTRGAASSSSASASSATNTDTNTNTGEARAAAVPTKQTKGKAVPKKEESVIDLVDNDSDKEDAAHSKKRKDDQSKNASKTSSSAKRIAGVKTPKSSHSRPFHNGGDDSGDGGGKQSAATATTASDFSRTTNRPNLVTNTKKQPTRQEDLNQSSGSDSDSDEEDELKEFKVWPYNDQEFCKRLIASMSSRSRREIIEGDDQRLFGKNASYIGCIEVLGSDGRGTLKYPATIRNGKKVYLHAAACAALRGRRKRGDTASHLCQNDHCINQNHLFWESLRVNDSRKTCYGFVLVGGKRITSRCNHNPPCLNGYSMKMSSINEEEKELVKNS